MNYPYHFTLKHKSRGTTHRVTINHESLDQAVNELRNGEYRYSKYLYTVEDVVPGSVEEWGTSFAPGRTYCAPECSLLHIDTRSM